MLVSVKKVKKKFIEKWHNKLKIQYTQDIWSIVYNIPYKCTTDTKLRWFQFRLIHRILGVNSFLLKINKVDSGLCSFCNLEEETIIHLFCGCPITLLFWNNVAQWLREISKTQVQIDEELCLFGVRSYQFCALNTIILISRFHIYKMKMNNKLPNFGIFKGEVKRYFDLERYIFIKNNLCDKFNKKWALYLEYFMQ